MMQKRRACVGCHLECGGLTPLSGERSITKRRQAGALQTYFGLAIAKYPSLLRTNRRGRPRGGFTFTLM